MMSAPTANDDPEGGSEPDLDDLAEDVLDGDYVTFEEHEAKRD
jgi:hypothetical protein